MRAKYISSIEGIKLSATAEALLLLLTLHSDNDNLVNKKKFISSVGLRMDPRTWNKYWNELIDHNILAKIDRYNWMISPYHSFTEGISNKVLIGIWEELCN